VAPPLAPRRSDEARRARRRSARARHARRRRRHARGRRAFLDGARAGLRCTAPGQLGRGAQHRAGAARTLRPGDAASVRAHRRPICRAAPGEARAALPRCRHRAAVRQGSRHVGRALLLPSAPAQLAHRRGRQKRLRRGARRPTAGSRTPDALLRAFRLRVSRPVPLRVAGISELEVAAHGCLPGARRQAATHGSRAREQGAR
jgi:hypothetical protein